ncbi:site-specific integrase [Amycolatopsis sp. NPDC051045]|uniref:tyrosine-type recombinase/integrase n=1 Tax=Amycolatopsis sp. NPDC051045 TaxID=3156922 RepID=UPI00343B797C
MAPWPDGPRRQLRRGGFATADAARSERDQFGATGGRGPADATMTMAQWLRLWLETLALRGSTLYSYRSNVETYLIPLLGGVLVRELTADRIQAMVADLIRNGSVSGQPLRPGTLRHVHATLRAALNAAVRRGLLPTNPAWHIHVPCGKRPHAVVWTAPRIAQWQATAQRPPVAVWTVDQTRAFLEHIHDHTLYPLFHLIALFGLRRGEAAGLRWCDIDLEQGLLTISHQIRQYGWRIEVGKPKSEASNRVIGLDSVTIALLRQYRENVAADVDPGSQDFMFTTRSGGMLTPQHLTHLLRALNEESGLPPIRLHDLRHGAGSLSLAAGNDLKTVQAMLGHSSIVLTADTYVSVLPDLACRAAEATIHHVLGAAKATAARLRGIANIAAAAA